MSKININMYASSNAINCWEDIDFNLAKQSVKKLQTRIAKAYLNSEYDKVIYLQHKLVHSFYAKSLSVKIITSNKGKRTPGVDDTIWTTSSDKFNAICELKRRGYNPLPLKRVYIPNPDGNMRPLSIPTMKDRAMQTLYKFTLEPISELVADPHSYAYRQNMGARDAVIRCCDVLSKYPNSKLILKADIKSCFDSIDHKWIMDNIPMDKEILWKFIKCGYIENGVFYPTEQGIPQGGCLSNVICNMVLDGLETSLKNRFNDSISMIRYADDFLIIVDKDYLMQVIPEVKQFLFQRGLELSSEKTKVSEVKNGITFLGFNIFEENNQVIVTPSRKSIDSLLYQITKKYFTYNFGPFDDLCKSLNMTIRGWINYYKNIVMVQSLYGVEFEITNLLFGFSRDYRITKFISKIFEELDF